ncbi:MAG: GAF domain-containing protein [Myxococcaceae bacterium]
MDARSWLSKVGLPVAVDVAAVRESQQVLWGVLDEAKKASLPATPSALNALYQYRVPKLSADGSCSLHDELDPKPYELGAVLGGRTIQNSFALITVDALVESVNARLKADWLGVYQLRTLPSGPALVKLAYRGVESRAEFPVTPEFAKSSNNATVALSGKALVLDDVRAHLAAGGAYYECDPKVQSEACVPLLDPNGKVVGIVDAESSTPRFFDAARLALVASLAIEAVSHLPR